MYELLERDPSEALALANEFLESSLNQSEIDHINWAKAYALCKLSRFAEAKMIWLEIFERTRNPRALHQVGMVERDSGNLVGALEIYEREMDLLDRGDLVAVCANLYELSYCNHLLGRSETALKFFKSYQAINSEDPIERACFYRLKGDLFKSSNPLFAKDAYRESLRLFEQAGHSSAVKEIEDRLKGLYFGEFKNGYGSAIRSK